MGIISTSSRPKCNQSNDCPPRLPMSRAHTLVSIHKYVALKQVVFEFLIESQSFDWLHLGRELVDIIPIKLHFVCLIWGIFVRLKITWNLIG